MLFTHSLRHHCAAHVCAAAIIPQVQRLNDLQTACESDADLHAKELVRVVAARDASIDALRAELDETLEECDEMRRELVSR